MIGTIVNGIAIVVGSGIGLLVKGKSSPRFEKIFFQAIGLFTIGLGANMVYPMENMLIVVGSLVAGSLCGEWLDLEGLIERFGEWIKRQLKLRNGRFTEGFITAFLLYSIGSMSLLGAIQEGVSGNPELLFTKSLLDGFSSVILSAAFGVGVLFSVFPLLLFQGGTTLIAMWGGDFMSTEMVAGVTVVGGVLLIGLGFNILSITKLKIVNMLPSLLLVILFFLMKNWVI